MSTLASGEARARRKTAASVVETNAFNSAATDAVIAAMNANTFTTLSGSRTLRSRFGRISHLR